MNTIIKGLMVGNSGVLSKIDFITVHNTPHEPVLYSSDFCKHSKETNQTIC